MSDTIRNLSDGEPYSPRGMLEGAWSNFQMRRIEAGGTASFVSDRAEHAFYVLRGMGFARSEDDTFSVGEGMAVTIPHGDRVEVEAGEAGMELFVCTLDV